MILFVLCYRNFRCGPCQRMSPFIEKLASTQDKLAVVKVDVDQCPGISESQHIEAMPTLRVCGQKSLRYTAFGYTDFCQWQESA